MTIHADHALTRQATIASAIMYAAGALLGALSLLLPHPSVDRPGLLWVLAGAAAAAAALQAAVLAVRERGLPMPLHAVSALLGSGLITLAVLAAGAGSATLYAVLYVLVVAFAFHFFPLWLAALQTAACALLYGAVLAVLGVPGAPARWGVLIGVALAASWLTGNLNRRARRLLERERQAVQRLSELERMREAFLQAVSHELRTPLTSVLGLGLTLQRHGGRLTPQELASLADGLVENGRRLEALVSDLLEVDRLARGVGEARRSPVDLVAVVADAVGAVDRCEQRVNVLVPPLVAWLDASKVERIVQNLVANALRHTPPETPVAVAAERAPEGLLLTVDDAGPGIPDGLKEVVFEPFVQGPRAAEAASPGTGIGLALVDRLARVHDGRAWVEDRPGGGARFRVLLPCRFDDPVLVPDDADGAVREGRRSPPP